MPHPIATIDSQPYRYFSLAAALGDALPRLPYSLRVVAESLLRHNAGPEALAALLARTGGAIPFRPARLILQDMLGLPLLVDIVNLREAVAQAGGNPTHIDMKLPVDLVIDHSLTIVDWAGPEALANNQRREFEVNRERFAFFKAAEALFANLRVIPPGGGILHQVNLEFLGQCVRVEEQPGQLPLLLPDSVLGTDSHTPMINGLGILGWGIGGLEAEAIMFGNPVTLNTPKVIGLRFTGALPADITATDLALTVTERLRGVGVVDCFVEAFGPGVANLTVADRATVANMAPEYGATCVYFPIDEQTVRYLRETGRPAELVRRVQAAAQAQHLWRTDDGDALEFEQVVELDLSAIRRSVSGPRRPEQRLDLAQARAKLSAELTAAAPRRFPVTNRAHDIGDGDVIVAAITSCTNTANPRNMITAGLVARNAAARGLRPKPWVKTSLAPGSRVVAAYLQASGLQPALDALGFHVAGFACSTCNGMSGPLPPDIAAAIRANGVQAVAVLSGNRNFEGRIHRDASLNLLAAPPLVVAYAVAGSILVDVAAEPLAEDAAGQPVFLADLWPAPAEVEAVLAQHVAPESYRAAYGQIAAVSEAWNAMPADPASFRWDKASTYVTRQPFITHIPPAAPGIVSHVGLRPLAILGDAITTDHISPSGAITESSAAGKFLIGRGVPPADFNSYGTRRGSADIVVRSTFANIRLRNEMTPGVVGSVTRLEPDGRVVSIFEAIESYRARGEGLIVIAGEQYGAGSSRDTAAKAPWLAGIKAVAAESFERIHRSNLVNMGLAPLQFPAGVNRHSLRLDGRETFDVTLAPDGSAASLTIHRASGETKAVPMILRLDNADERITFAHGGLLPRTYRAFLKTT